MIRHGESEANEKGMWTGWLDPPLVNKGFEQAEAVRRIIGDQTFDRIYSSDLLRAKQTAETAIPGCKYEIEPMLREVNVGSLAGKPLQAAYDEKGQPMHLNGYEPFGGEGLDAFRKRVISFIKRLEKEPCERVAVFCHGGVLRRFVEYALGVQPARGSILYKNCAVAIFEVEKENWKLYSLINQF